MRMAAAESSIAASDTPARGAELGGKVALVTGGTRGIGLAIAQALLAAGARVAITGHHDTSIESAAAALGTGDRWAGWADDLADPDAPARVVARTVDRFQRLDLLINNAGITGSTDPWTVQAQEWDRVQAINLRAAFFCAREAANAMKLGGRGGSIVNVSSVAGQIGGVATGPAYVASKAGLIGLTRSLARHFAPINVRVNCLAPADIETDMTAAWGQPLRERLTAMTPLARFGRVDEVAAAAVFLCAEASSYLTGQTLNVNGGIYMG
jgi:3-oxoacyl-[acyl-carrier protein] reductase